MTATDDSDTHNVPWLAVAPTRLSLVTDANVVDPTPLPITVTDPAPVVAALLFALLAPCTLAPPSMLTPTAALCTGPADVTATRLASALAGPRPTLHPMLVYAAHRLASAALPPSRPHTADSTASADAPTLLPSKVTLADPVPALFVDTADDTAPAPARS